MVMMMIYLYGLSPRSSPYCRSSSCGNTGGAAKIKHAKHFCGSKPWAHEICLRL